MSDVITPVTATVTTDVKSTQNDAAANTKKASKKRTINPFWVKVNKARKVFDGLYEPSNSLKWNCLAEQLKDGDPQKNLDEYWSVVKLVLGRTIIHEECKERGYDPEIFATHVVFLGSATMHKVMDNGLSCLKSPHLYTEAFLPKNWEEGIRKLLEEVKKA